MSTKLSIRDLDLENKVVFIRVDFNVPLAPGGQEITSDKRIKASLPTIQYALEKGAGVVLASHLGRPKGKPNPEMSLKPVAKRLQELLGRPVNMAPDCVGPEVEAMRPKPGEVVLLENLRFHPEEEKNDPEFSKKLAALCDVYVNDAFGSAHRAHASTVGMIQFVPKAAAGLLMDKELEWLGKATSQSRAAVHRDSGGAKVSDKIEVIQNLSKIVDKLLIGGAMAYTFFKAKGEPTGKSLVEDDKVDLAKQLIDQMGDKLMLPVDHAVAPEFKGGGEAKYVDTIPEGMMALDIGPKTVEMYSDVIRVGEDNHLERSDGCVRDASVRYGHCRAGKGCRGIRSGVGGRRRRFGEGHQDGRSGRQDHARIHRWRSIARVSLGHRTSRSRGFDGQDRRLIECV